jgi:hypothetical protein
MDPGQTFERQSMSETSRGDLIVHLSNQSDAALAEPSFIIKVGEVYYVTLAAWAYDPAKAIIPEHKAGCEEIAKQFRLSEPVEARIASPRQAFVASQTHPPANAPNSPTPPSPPSPPAPQPSPPKPGDKAD